MRVASHGGTRPPWRGRSALPVRLAIRCCTPSRVRAEAYQAGAVRSGRIGHRPERDRISRRLDGGNAVFPDLSATRPTSCRVERGSASSVKRSHVSPARLAKPELAGASPAIGRISGRNAACRGASRCRRRRRIRCREPGRSGLPGRRRLSTFAMIGASQSGIGSASSSRRKA